MYREPHLQKKSDECAAIWYEWYDAKFKDKDEEKANKLREKWNVCTSEHSEMISQEAKTNPRYTSIRKI